METKGHAGRKPNRLAGEKSPYLLQHAYNPVDWNPWGPAALEQARRENKPIFLSVGYATCHWCHVMERESFENGEIGEILRKHFVSIKVDREERPDIDETYMQAVQAMTQQGGWPMTVFLTPDLKPFYAGTYFPPEDRWGRPGFKSLLLKIAAVWEEQREQVLKSADQIVEAITKEGRVLPAEGEPSLDWVGSLAGQMKHSFDDVHGGFGNAPKFPRSETLQVLLREHRRTKDAELLAMVEKTLEEMANGGIYDHLGGGFARYSTDAEWLVPHFEKMLYDNALLVVAYIEAYQVTGKPFYADVARDVLRYVRRDMTDPGGAFYSAEDADSEGEEGKFYVWTPSEIAKVLGGDDAKLATSFWGVTDEGNFEHSGASILHVTRDAGTWAKLEKLDPAEANRRIAGWKEKLLAVRSKRVRPLRDDKILAGWNGLMISAFAKAGEALDDPAYVADARKAAGLILDAMRKDGRLLRRHRAGESGIDGFLEDYAFFTAALIDLFEATGEARWLAEAKRLAGEMRKHFEDTKEGGFFSTADHHENLLGKRKEAYDGAVPSGNSVAALVLLRLGVLLDDAELTKAGERTIRAFRTDLSRTPVGFPVMLMAVERLLAPGPELVVTGDPASDARPFLAAFHRRFIPGATVVPLTSAGAAETEKLVLLAQGKGGKGPVAYLCERGACKAPAKDVAVLEKQLDSLVK